MNNISPTGYDTHITHSQIWNEIMHGVYGPRQGGAIIFIDAQNAQRGIAKTSCMVAVGKLLARAFGYDVKKEDFTLSGKEYLNRMQEGVHFDESQPSVMGIDEFVGGGTGDKRRSMAKQNLILASAWQMLRTKRVVTLATLPDWNEADVRLQKYADYRFWCQERPIGYFKPYKVTVAFDGGMGSSVGYEKMGKGNSTERITFPNMHEHKDPHYMHVKGQKDTLLDSDSFDANEVLSQAEETDEEMPSEEEIRREMLTKVSILMHKPWTDQYGMSYSAIEEAIDSERGSTWIGDKNKEWQRGKHRDLVEVPDDQPTDALA